MRGVLVSGPGLKHCFLPNGKRGINYLLGTLIIKYPLVNEISHIKCEIIYSLDSQLIRIHEKRKQKAFFFQQVGNTTVVSILTSV